MVQAVQKTVKIPHAFLDMVQACRCATTGAGWSRQCRKLWSLRSWCCPLSVSVDGVSQQRRWFLRCHGLRAILATATLLRLASLCRVSRGVWRKVSSPEVLRLPLRERRMGCATYGAVLTLRSGRVRFQDLASWTRMLTCPCWPRRGVVAVLQLQFIDWWSAHHGYGELMRLLFRAGLTPAIRAGKGWRGRRELAPRCSATQLGACIVGAYGETHTSYTRSEPQHHKHHKHNKHN